MRREIEIQAETYRVIKNVIEKGGGWSDRDDLQILEVNLEKPVDGRADIVLMGRYKRSVRPLLVIETKRQGVPLSSKVISQARSYATKLDADFFATFNGNLLAMYGTHSRNLLSMIYASGNIDESLATRLLERLSDHKLRGGSFILSPLLFSTRSRVMSFDWRTHSYRIYMRK